MHNPTLKALVIATAVVGLVGSVNGADKSGV